MGPVLFGVTLKETAWTDLHREVRAGLGAVSVTNPMLDEVMEHVRAAADTLSSLSSIFIWVPLLVGHIRTLSHSLESLVSAVSSCIATCPHCQTHLSPHLQAARDYLHASTEESLK